ncbi:hypothetical protein OHR68_07005 [Spirillospora sp. NBC_00431]
MTYSDDPMLGGPKATVTAIGADGVPITDGQAIQPVPVALFEPSRVLAVKDLRTTEIHDARMEGIIGQGFHRMPRGLLINFPADGWGLYRTATGLLLRDRFGGVWAEGTLSLDPRWISEATSQGWVTVFYGPHLGIRVPPGKTERTYTLQDRIDEFRKGRSHGMCASANVRWHPVPTGETLNWVLLPPGAFGQPLPLAYVPQFNFTPHGGPETFGFVPTPETYSEVPVALADIPIARNLVGDATPTDFDLFQPRLDPGLNFVAGYHAPASESIDSFTAWQQAAHAHGRVLVLTGHHDLPAGPELIHQPLQNIRENTSQALQTSHAAIIPLTRASRLSLPAWEDR